MMLFSTILASLRSSIDFIRPAGITMGRIGAIQVLRNAVGGGWVSAFPEKSVMKVYSSTLLASRRGGWGSNFQEKSVT